MFRILSSFANGLILIALLLVSPGSLGAQVESGPTAEPIITQSDETGLRLHWRLPDYALQTMTVDGIPYTQVSILGLSFSDQPGRPQVPIYGGLVGLPPTGEAVLRIVAVEQEMVVLPHLPLPAPIPQPVQLALTAADDLPTAGPMQRQPVAAAYSRDIHFPQTVAHLAEPSYVRHHRVAQLTINPIRINPVQRRMLVVRSVELEIIFSEAAVIDAVKQASTPSPTTQSLALTLLNPQAMHWKIGSASQRDVKQIVSVTEMHNATKILVKETGLYVLTYVDLLGAGLPVANLDPRSFAMSHGYPRQPIAIVVEGEADGVFNVEDRILFYAQPEFSRYVDYDVYFLTYSGAGGLRMESRAGNPELSSAGVARRTATFEINHAYDSLYPGHNGDRWFWDNLRQPDDTSGTYTLWLESPTQNGPSATLTVWLQGYTSDETLDPDHIVSVAWGEVVLGQIKWDGDQAQTATFDIAGNLLAAGVNQVTLSLPGTGSLLEGVWLDAIEIIYPTTARSSDQFRFQGEAGQKYYTIGGWTNQTMHIYDVSDPAAVKPVTNYSYDGSTLIVGDVDSTVAEYLIVPNEKFKTPASIVAAKTFTTPSTGADYIIITHPNFISAITPLADHRVEQGLRVVLVDAEVIYDNFGQGRMDPVAIWRFLQDAYETWVAPAPLYVLLVGDGSHDLKNYSGWQPKTFIPPFLAQVDPWLRETAADNRYVTVSGFDVIPDMLLGRLPVNTVAETSVIVNKIINYETNPFPGGWNTRHLFVADNPDQAGNFHRSADKAYNRVSSPFEGRRFYLGNGSSSQAHIYDHVDDLRAAFLPQMNQGAGIVTYHGHSTWHQWASESIFHWNLNAADNDVLQLNNGSRLPFIFEMTCFTGYFHHPEYATLDEALLRQPDGGAIAVWGSSGLGVATGHSVLQDRFYDEIWTQNQTNLGAAIFASKLELIGRGRNVDLVDTYTLFGDPALNLAIAADDIVPFSEYIYLPLVTR